jgi:putative FmdB family regulatory protein
MPIYAYSCASCGLQQDVMQKMSDKPLTTCPECGKETLSKQLTAAGFHLKGTGYYVTDFKGGPRKSETLKPDANQAAKSDASPASAPVASTSSAPMANGTA